MGAASGTTQGRGWHNLDARRLGSGRAHRAVMCAARLPRGDGGHIGACRELGEKMEMLDEGHLVQRGGREGEGGGALPRSCAGMGGGRQGGGPRGEGDRGSRLIGARDWGKIWGPPPAEDGDGCEAWRGSEGVLGSAAFRSEGIKPCRW